MNDQQLKNMFVQSGALITGHFLLTSGMHSEHYFEKFELLKNPDMTAHIGRALADRFRDDGVDVVVGPAVGGILLAHETAKSLGVRAIFTERVDGRMVLRRGFQIDAHERVLVVEDVVTTGGSVVEVLQVVDEAGATLAGVGLMVDRTESGADFGVKTESLYRLDAAKFAPEACPLCQKGVPLTERGSRLALMQKSGGEHLDDVKPKAQDADIHGGNSDPLVGIVVGSRSDLPVVKKATRVLSDLNIPYEVRIMSAHRTPAEAQQYAVEAADRGVRVLIAGAGLAAHLAGVIAAGTLLPVVGIPVASGPLNGLDALYATVQMPPGTPVATVGVDAGANAALLAARILALNDRQLVEALADEREARRQAVLADDAEVRRNKPV